MEDEINLMDYINVILKWKYLIFFMAIVMSLIGGLPSLLRKETYEAKSVLLLKEKDTLQNNMAGLQAILGNSAGNKNTFPVLLKSRAVAGKVIDDLNLKNRIKGWNDPGLKKQDLVSSVQSMVKSIDREGMFEIIAVTDDPVLSADLANGFAKAGASLWNEMNYTEARKKREYIEGQLPRVDADLRRAEITLKKFAIISPNPNFSLSMELKRLQREYEIQGDVYTMLRKEYESAKIEESKDIAPFSVIDQAEMPIKPVPPKTVLNFTIGLIVGIFAGTFFAFGAEYWEKAGKNQ
jgi:uncharacterized protein involved in exopolysaccharide biosynthesis